MYMMTSIRDSVSTPDGALSADDCCSAKEEELAQLASRSLQRRVLIVVLGINVAMFATEFTAGIVARSSALMADSVDMLGDASVYLLSLYALSRGARWHAGAAMVKSGIIFLFGIWILVEVGRRLLDGGSPSAETMGVVGLLALVANVTCLVLLWRFRAQDVNMSSTFECSRNDVLANMGVLIAASGVWVTGAAWPDLTAGLLIAAIFLRSSWTIARSAAPQLRATPA